MTEAAPQQQAPAQEGQQATEAQAEQAFSQKDVNKIAGERAKEAEQRAIGRLLQDTGYESADDLKAAALEQAQRRESEETAADKAEKAKAKAEERATAAEERYTNTLREFALRESLRDAGINPERLKGAMRLAETSALEVDKEGNVSGLDEVVEAVREEAPEFFGPQEKPRVNAPQTNGTGVSTPANQTDPQQSYANWLAGILEQA